MKKYDPGRDSEYAKLARQRLVVGDLFAYDVPVITVMTKGRYYGALSRRVATMGVRIPDLALRCAELVEAEDGKYIFVALWNDENTYSGRHVYDCTRAILREARHHRIPEVAMPLLGGNERARFLGAMEQAVDHAEDEADEAETFMPSVVFVSDLELL